jgi:predicted phosphoribosyltransferase
MRKIFDMKIFKNRLDAGKALANKLLQYKDNPETIVLACRKAGLPVAYEVSNRLRIKLEIFLLSNIKAQQKKSIAIGTVASGGIEVLNEGIIKSLKIPREQLGVNILVEKKRLMKRQLGLRGERPYPNLANRTLILVDDGVGGPAKIRATVSALKKVIPKRIIFAVPIITSQVKSEIRGEVDQLVTIAISDSLSHISESYENYSRIADHKVRMFLS